MLHRTLGVKSGSWLIAVCAAVVAALALTACGSSSTSKSASTTSSAAASSSSTAAGSATSAQAQAQAVVAKLSAPRPFSVPALPKRPPTGKSLAVVTCTLPLCLTKVGTAAQKLGWSYHSFEFDLSKGPAAYVTAFQQALQEKPDYILTVGIFPPSVITPELAQAHAENIPVMSITGLAGNPAIKSCENCAAYLAAAGKVVADQIVAGGATGSQTLYPGDPTSVGTGQIGVGIDSEFARLGEGKPSTLTISSANSAAQTAQSVVSYIQRHPNIKAVFSSFADETVGLPPALAQAGLASKVKYYVSGPQAPDVAFIKNGQEAGAAAIENDATWWRALYEATKLSLSQPVNAAPIGWLGVMTKDNAASLVAAGGGQSNPPHYEQAYLKAWHVG